MSSAKTAKTTPKAIVTTTSPSTLSAEATGQNEDIRNEILLRLPLKSLIRLKSVSKLWLSHITSPNFVHSQATFHNLSISGVIVKRQCKKVLRGIPEFDFFNLRGDGSSAGSSRAPFNRRLTFTNEPSLPLESCKLLTGLLLCTKVLKQNFFQSPALPRECYIYNPATKQYSMLSRSTYSTKAIGFSLAFDLSAVRSEPEKMPGEVVQNKLKTGVFKQIDGVAQPESEINWNSILVSLPGMGVWPDDAYQYIGTLAPVA